MGLFCPGPMALHTPVPLQRCHRPGPQRARCRARCRRARPPPEHGFSLLALNGLRVSETTGAGIAHLGLERGPPGSSIVTGSSVNAMIYPAPARPRRKTPWMLDICVVRADRAIKQGGRGGTGDLGPCRPGPTPAESPRGSASVSVARRREPGGKPTGTGTRATAEGDEPENAGRRETRGRRAKGKNPAGKRETGGKPAGEPEAMM
jgi:hypothetical protein